MYGPDRCRQEAHQGDDTGRAAASDMDCYSRLPISAVAALMFIPALLSWGESELDSLVDEAMANSPTVLAARARVEQALCRHRELLEFFDPSLYVIGGKSERARGVPGSTGFVSGTNNAQEVSGGVEVAVAPGAYVAAGAAERFLAEPSDYNHLYQSLLGLRVRVPLLRDRGFSQWDLQRSASLADFNAVVSGLLVVMQSLRHDVELAYISCYETLSAYHVAKEATSRFQGLLDEAGELARLRVVPEYQVFPAEMELGLRQANELRALQAHETSLARLSGFLGTGREVGLASGPEILIELAGAARLPSDIPLEEALLRRGTYLQLTNQMEGIRAVLRRARDDLRSDVSLNMGLTWQGESPDAFVGGRSLTSEKAVGGEVVLVWRRPLEFRGARSRLSRHRARIAELKHRLTEVKISTETELAVGTLTYRRSRERLRALERALRAARETVSAEQERFRLGEARSRNVLDAEKDLTDVLERQTRTAAELLRARSNVLFASGYELDR